MRSIIGIMGFFGVVAAGVLYGSPMMIFFDIPSLLFVFGTIISLSVAKYSPKELISFSDEVVMSLINFSLIGGGIGFIVGLVQMLQNMSDPASIGPAMAVALLTVFYSIIIYAGLYGIKKEINTRRMGAFALVGSLATLIPLGFVMISFT